MVNRRGFVVRGATGLGAMAVMSSGMAEAAADKTMSLNVLYPNRPGARFDMAYYRDKHIPLAMKVMRADKVILIEGVPNGAVAPPFAMIAHFQFASPEALKAALANPAMADVRADIPTFTDITPTVMLGQSSAPAARLRGARPFPFCPEPSTSSLSGGLAALPDFSLAHGLDADGRRSPRVLTPRGPTRVRPFIGRARRISSTALDTVRSVIPLRSRGH